MCSLLLSLIWLDPRYCRTPGSSVPGFPSKNTGAGCRFPPLGHLPNLRIKTHVARIAGGFLYHWAITLLNRLFTAFPVQWWGKEFLFFEGLQKQPFQDSFWRWFFTAFPVSSADHWAIYVFYLFLSHFSNLCYREAFLFYAFKLNRTSEYIVATSFVSQICISLFSSGLTFA